MFNLFGNKNAAVSPEAKALTKEAFYVLVKEVLELHPDWLEDLIMKVLPDPDIIEMQAMLGALEKYMS